MEAINYFSATTGLSINNKNNNIFLTGVSEVIKRRLIEIIGLTIGKLPSIFLGLPLTYNNWYKMDYRQLSAKITEK